MAIKSDWTGNKKITFDRAKEAKVTISRRVHVHPIFLWCSIIRIILVVDSSTNRHFCQFLRMSAYERVDCMYQHLRHCITKARQISRIWSCWCCKRKKISIIMFLTDRFCSMRIFSVFLLVRTTEPSTVNR